MENPNTSKKGVGPKQGMQPYHVLAFTIAVFAVLLGVMAVFPKGGLPVTDQLTLYFPTLEEFFAEDTTKADMEQILAELDELAVMDTAAKPAAYTTDPLPEGPVKSPNKAKKIQYPDGDRSILYPAFAALEQAGSGEKPTRIIHFGDSQIEGDRMTSLIRSKLQEKFGGSGPGLFAAVPMVPSLSVRQSSSEHWKRYPGYGSKDPSVDHKRYGALAAFARFNPIQPDSMLDSLPSVTAWLQVLKSSAGYSGVKSFSRLKLYYGHARRPFSLKLFADDAPVSEDSIPASTGLKVKTWNFASTPDKLMLFFEGKDSPEVYGLSLESSSGIAVDNVAMRGQSGTLFGGLDYGIFKGMIVDLNAKLLFLQYGGNTVPYIKDEKAARNYGNSFRRQISYLKDMVPGLCVVVLGPSDMATKVEGKLQTYPHLEDVRNALKDAAFEAGAAYFDIYEVMGGYNSMIGWVENEPSLAAPDYVHFNISGAKKIAKAFVTSFLEDYEDYKRRKVR